MNIEVGDTVLVNFLSAITEHKVIVVDDSGKVCKIDPKHDTLGYWVETNRVKGVIKNSPETKDTETTWSKFKRKWSLEPTL